LPVTLSEYVEAIVLRSAQKKLLRSDESKDKRSWLVWDLSDTLRYIRRYGLSRLSLRQKWQTRNHSFLGYLNAIRKDRRQAIYKLLPLVTDPYLRGALARACARFKQQSQSFDLDADALSQLVQLQRDGVVSGLPEIEPGPLQDIIDYFRAQACHDPWRPHLGQFAWDSAPSKECNMGLYTAEQIVRAPHVMLLFNHPRLLQLAEAYIGCKPTLDNIGCWWSYGGRSLAKGTQKFHRDFDSMSGFKVFFYLTNVGPEQGPHEYVRGSHVKQVLGTGAGIPDELLWQHCDTADTLVITGRAGTSFLADTFGIHRGQLPAAGFRLMLCAQYNLNVSPHGPLQPFPAEGSDSFDTYVNRLYLKRP
jgi:hypothetical protein